MFLISPHLCDENKPELKHLVRYSKQISGEWKEIALQLGIPKHEISTIDHEKQCLQDKCFEMLQTWLERTVSPCWCHFVQALIDHRLYEVAKNAQMHFITSHDSATVTSPGAVKNNVHTEDESTITFS